MELNDRLINLLITALKMMEESEAKVCGDLKKLEKAKKLCSSIDLQKGMQAACSLILAK